MRSGISCVATVTFLFVAASLCGSAGASAQVDVPEALPVVGHGVAYAVTPDLSASVETEAGRMWTHSMHIADATFLKPHFVGFDLRPGDLLRVRSASGRVIEELTGRGPKRAVDFWGLSGLGAELHFEFMFRGEYKEGAPFSIDEVVVGNADLFGEPGVGPGGTESVCAPEDFDDVFCFQPDAGKWANVLASVGVMSVGGNPATAIFCSGSNVSQDNYVLTNDHCLGGTGSCGGGNCANAEFVFKFYRTGCNIGAPTTMDWEGFRCDAIVASSPCISCDQGLNDLDFTLASVIGDPAATYGWVTPDPVPITSGEAIYIVQHPAGRPHEITHGSGPDVVADGTVLRYYDTLDTEGGSSGSPIFREADDKLIGLHHCGGCSSPGVGNRGMLMSDIYPHIAPFLGGPPSEIFDDGFETGDTTRWTCAASLGKCTEIAD